MVKNVIIAIQTIVIVAGIAWYFAYRHIIEQISITTNFGLIANQTRFMKRVEKRIVDGQCDKAQHILNTTAAAYIVDMKAMPLQLDFSYPGALDSARDAGKMLEEVGVHDISDAVEDRARKTGKTDFN